MRALDGFLALAGAAVAGHPAGRRVAALLGAAGEAAASPAPAQAPVCAHLPAALAAAPAALGAAFAALAPHLAWRAHATVAGYAGAPVLGPGGLEQRGGLVAGFSLLAPGAVYPDHAHPPEEIYLVLSGGEWMNAETPWHAPGPGGLVHNPPGIVHAMRGTAVPLLAIWFLLPLAGAGSPAA